MLAYLMRHKRALLDDVQGEQLKYKSSPFLVLFVRQMVELERKAEVTLRDASF